MRRILIRCLGPTGRRRKFYQFTAMDEWTRLRMLGPGGERASLLAQHPTGRLPILPVPLVGPRSSPSYGSVKDQPEPVSTIKRNRVKHRTEPKREASSEQYDALVGRGGGSNPRPMDYEDLRFKRYAVMPGPRACRQRYAPNTFLFASSLNDHG